MSLISVRNHAAGACQIIRLMHYLFNSASLLGRTQTSPLAERICMPALRPRSGSHSIASFPAAMQQVSPSNFSHRRHELRAHQIASAQMVWRHLSDEFGQRWHFRH